MATSFVFTQLDTWFFKESRPMESVGGSELSSAFPPSCATLSGTIRSLIGETLGIDWQKYHRGQEQQLKFNLNPNELIGNGDDTGKLRFEHPKIVVKHAGKWQELAPTPADLLKTEDNKLVRLLIAKQPIACDLGRVRLPCLPPKQKRAKPLGKSWLLPKGWHNYKIGHPVSHKDVVTLEDLIVDEPRLGISRDNHTATSVDGMLYQTRHVRVSHSRFEDVAIKMVVHGLPMELASELGESEQIVRFGGEGRMAFVCVSSQPDKIDNNQINSSTYQLVFGSPVYLQSDLGWLPPDAFKITHDSSSEYDHDIWRFSINGKQVDLLCQISDKPIQVGGWDFIKREPKPLRAYLPQGSCWYLKSEQSLVQKDVEAIGELTQFGYGNATLLAWKEQ
ncbi:type III-B CRISPR module-associated Cmr3 family protein [Vibrio sp. WXL210]|uniref:type III-B CRISPR module-associated Cmr3 family protein n=1 Tax=Vibrio sp. WXL210 TaxID=3450709 RepID=UPI003EC656C3